MSEKKSDKEKMIKSIKQSESKYEKTLRLSNNELLARAIQGLLKRDS